MRVRRERFQVVEDDGRRALMVDGVIQSVALGENEPPSGYWAAMLPLGDPRDALFLGLGGGTLPHLLHRRNPNVRMVGVDADAGVVHFAREQFQLRLPNLEVVIADAFDFVAGCRHGFDYVAVDLFRGYNLQRGALAKPFLNRLQWIIGARGEVSFNLFADRRTERNMTRLGKVLRVFRVDEVGRNVVVHCRSA